MPSYGSGFAQGMGAGSNMANNAVNVYQKTKLFGQSQDDRDTREQTLGNLFGGQQQQDLSEYDAAVSGLGELDQGQTDSLAIGREELAKAKPSQLFFDGVTNMGSQERLGHMIELSQQNGIKINDASLTALKGVNQLFDSQRQADDTHEQRVAQTNLFNQRAENPSMGRGTPQTIQEFEYYKENGGELPYDEFLMNIKRRSNELSPYQQENNDLKKQAYALKVSQAREKSVKYLAENMANWDDLNDDQKEKAIEFYTQKNFTPKVNESKHMFSKNEYSLDGEDPKLKEEPKKEAEAKKVTKRVKLKDGRIGVEYSDGSRGIE